MEPTAPTSGHFVTPERIEQLRKCKPDTLDFRKLIRLCEEINTCYSQGCYYAVLMLLRALMDHVPPAFGLATFNEVANNYTGSGRSFREAAQHLSGAARNFANSYLHGPMRNSESVPTSHQVEFRSDLDFLLDEIVRISPNS